MSSYRNSYREFIAMLIPTEILLIIVSGIISLLSWIPLEFLSGISSETPSEIPSGITTGIRPEISSMISLGSSPGHSSLLLFCSRNSFRSSSGFFQRSLFLRFYQVLLPDFVRIFLESSARLSSWVPSGISSRILLSI